MKVKDVQKLSILRYTDFSRRSFLKGAMAVGGALALAGCNKETITNTVTVTDKQTVTNTVTVTEKNTVTVTDTKTVTVTESAPVVPETPAEVKPMVSSPAYILPDYVNCVGCNNCMLACTLEHYGDVVLKKSNIKVHAVNIKGGMVDVPILCMKCSDAPCMAACPDKVAAISRDAVTGAMKIDHDKCTLCELCVEACDEQRTGCLSIDEDEQKVIGMCDMCDGNPACVISCPRNILEVVALGAENRGMAIKPEVIAEKAWKILYQV